MSNCTILVEQKNGKKIKQKIFSFDDYRVATAIENLLCNIEYVSVNCCEYTPEETPHEP